MQSTVIIIIIIINVIITQEQVSSFLSDVTNVVI